MVFQKGQEYDNVIASRKKRHHARVRGIIAGWLIWQVIRLSVLVGMIVAAMWIYNHYF